jgi:hypothetical protein
MSQTSSLDSHAPQRVRKRSTASGAVCGHIARLSPAAYVSVEPASSTSRCRTSCTNPEPHGRWVRREEAGAGPREACIRDSEEEHRRGSRGGREIYASPLPPREGGRLGWRACPHTQPGSPVDQLSPSLRAWWYREAAPRTYLPVLARRQPPVGHQPRRERLARAPVVPPAAGHHRRHASATAARLG